MFSVSTGNRKKMISQKLDELIKECGGLSGFARELQNQGFEKISHTAIRNWYESNATHPLKKYHDAIKAVAKNRGLVMTDEEVFPKHEQ